MEEVRIGATRLRLLVPAAVMASRILRMNHVAELSEFLLLIESLARSLQIASICWLLDIAVEPYVRRLWPDVLISWNRLLAGRLRNPRIGRDILIGGLVGVAGTALTFWLGIILVLTRLGLFACVILFFYLNLGLLFPLTLDASVWYAGTSWAAPASAVGLAVYGFVIASR